MNKLITTLAIATLAITPYSMYSTGDSAYDFAYEEKNDTWTNREQDEMPTLTPDYEGVEGPISGTGETLIPLPGTGGMNDLVEPEEPEIPVQEEPVETVPPEEEIQPDVSDTPTILPLFPNQPVVDDYNTPTTLPMFNGQPVVDEVITETQPPNVNIEPTDDTREEPVIEDDVYVSVDSPKTEIVSPSPFGIIHVVIEWLSHKVFVYLK